MRPLAPLLAALLLLAGCASDGKPLEGAVGAFLSFPRADGEVSIPGTARTTDGPEPASAAGLYLDLLPAGWYGTFRAETLLLPQELELPGTRALTYQTWEIAAGPCVVRTEGFRLDLFAGGRVSLLHAADGNWDPELEGDEWIAWGAPIAGLRAEARLSSVLALRLRGDGDLRNSDESRAWKGSLSGVVTVSESIAIIAGWEMSSIHFDRHSGADRGDFDADLSGPFLALEVRF